MDGVELFIQDHGCRLELCSLHFHCSLCTLDDAKAQSLHSENFAYMYLHIGFTQYAIFLCVYIDLTVNLKLLGLLLQIIDD